MVVVVVAVVEVEVVLEASCHIHPHPTLALWDGRAAPASPQAARATPAHRHGRVTMHRPSLAPRTAKTPSPRAPPSTVVCHARRTAPRHDPAMTRVHPRGQTMILPPGQATKALLLALATAGVPLALTTTLGVPHAPASMRVPGHAGTTKKVPCRGLAMMTGLPQATKVVPCLAHTSTHPRSLPTPATMTAHPPAPATAALATLILAMGAASRTQTLATGRAMVRHPGALTTGTA